MRTLAILLPLVAGCHGPGRVEYLDGRCVVDGRVATLGEVEEGQAKISERIVARQPIMVLVTILVVLLAGASHVEKLVLLFSTRRAGAHGLGDRIRIALDRYRDHPLRYFSIVVGTLLGLGLAGGAYVFLDAEKRANERALGLLQFCHVALRNQQAGQLLDEEKRNLQHIESTAGNIRSLIDRLPPEEKADAQKIVEQLRRALADQGRLVGSWQEKSDESARQLREHTALVEQGLSTLASDFKSVPSALHDLDQKVAAADRETHTRLDGISASLAHVQSALDGLAARPACPACNCEGPSPPPLHR